MSKKPMMFGDEAPGEKAEKGAWDPYTQPDYIPGYSEIVKARDFEKGVHMFDGNKHMGPTEEDKREFYRRVGTEPKPTKHEFRWVRVSDPGGRNSYEADRQLMLARHEGYDLVKVSSKDEFTERYGFGFPPGARRHADGTIRRMDVALAAISREDAKRVEAKRKAKAARYEGQLEEDAWSGNAAGEKVPYSTEAEEHGTRRLQWTPEN